MSLAVRSKSLVYFAGLLTLFASSLPAFADDTEHRDFSIYIDGKDAGVSRMTIVQKDDGTTYMSGSVDVKFRHLLIDYTLKIQAQEWWKDGKLTGLKTIGTDNNKKVDVTVASENNQLRMRVNGKDSMLRPDIWTSSYWKLADARFHNKQVPIVDIDTGKEFTSELKYIGAEKVPVGGKFEDCYHFRVTAPVGPIDLWFDRYHRLVRQEFTELGHKTIVQLTHVRR